MDICIVADDLTGANDSGVQCARYGYRPSVAVNARDTGAFVHKEALIIDTDSREMNTESAYRTVKNAVRPFAESPPKLMYKKIDSTMRGNIGRELDALYEAFSPDFILVNPAYPENGRTVINGELYVNSTALKETGITTLPNQTVRSSTVIDLLQAQSSNKAYHLSEEEISSGELLALLKRLKREGVGYLSFDGETEEQMLRQSRALTAAGYDVIWAGSAGVMKFLPEIYGLNGSESSTEKADRLNECESVLIVAGSRSDITQKQKAHLEVNYPGWTVPPEIFLDPGWQSDASIKDILRAASKRSHPVMLISTDTTLEAVENVKAKAEAVNIPMVEATKKIAEGLGRLTRLVFDINTFDALVMTGGDVAKAVCVSLDSTEFELIQEFEPGIPVGRLRGYYNPIAITKAGAFGTEKTFVHAIETLRGEILT
ncbi:four-carbon acid sugar kinase family protein [Marinococcus halotolerans]|uniref:four-carbon acid sugar kinase family protein n=1 Tax=Marinococcus halotolerans TaxID=301092 RepID=UPI0003B522B7|nr:four-carbon acid sugar kinase family protein [Marinococcus halotolerans]